ncbi:MAG: hypothetical protein E6J61_04775 [Deltaproteobacteria bacterium]|nr:MAG: hypothetical protein E6J61_04775 [Deltaproteobacteria bacterium]
MKRAGPSLLTWMIGRLAHPASARSCDACGKLTDGTGQIRLLPVLVLCEACRRVRLVESLREPTR